MDVSVVIPAFNEEGRLANTLERIYSYLSAKGWQYEVIVVDDGSIDRTKEIALASGLNRSGNLVLLRNEKNMGKGFSVRKGISASRFGYVLFSDADLSTPIEELDKLFSVIGPDYDIAIGSRSIAGAEVKIHQPFYREYMGRFFNLLVQSLVVKRFIDTQCGFKLFKAKQAKEIAAQLKINGYAFDVEMLYLSVIKGYRVKEVPVVWVNSPASRVNPLIDSVKMFFELLKIKRFHREN